MPNVETAAVVLRLTAYVHEEDGLWVAGCPSLDVFSQGETEDRARTNLHEAVELWIDSCLERNTLSKALQELGWYRISSGVEPSKHADVVGIVGLKDETAESLGEEYSLEVTIPAYQAAIFSDSSAGARC